MRPPRFQFSDEVRSTTRWMAAESVRDGTVAGTPEELDAWISRTPQAREPLERGGYASDFTADDLYPLYEVFVGKAGGAVPRAENAPGPSPARWSAGRIVVLALAIAVVVVLLVVLLG